MHNYVPRQANFTNTLDAQVIAGGRCRLDAITVQHLGIDAGAFEIINIRAPGGGDVLWSFAWPAGETDIVQIPITLPLGGLVCPNGFELQVEGGNANANVKGSIQYGVARKDLDLVMVDTWTLTQVGEFASPSSPITHPMIGLETRANPPASGPLTLATDTDDIVAIIPPGYDDAGGKGVPIVVGYHGHGLTAGAQDPFNLSILPDVCREVGAIFLSVTGYDGLTWPSSIWSTTGGGGMLHVDAAIQWALDRFNVDPDRIFMSGYSGGGCHALTYAATHRDPAGIMIAGVIPCAGLPDVVQRYHALSGPSDETDKADKASMEFASNMNGGYVTAAEQHRFQRVSSLYIDEATYVAGSGGGTYQGAKSQGLSLEGTAVWQFYDTQDTTTVGLPNQNDQLYDMLVAAGHTDIQRTKTSDAVNPHDWDLLIPKKQELIQWIRTRRVNRYPSNFKTCTPEGLQVASFAEITAPTSSFARQRTATSPGVMAITLSELNNLNQIRWDFEKTAFSHLSGGVGDPLSVTVPNNSATLQVTNLSWTPTVVTGADAFTINPAGIPATLHPAVEFTKALAGTVTIE